MNHLFGLRHLPLFRTIKNEDMRTFRIVQKTSAAIGLMMLMMMAGINVDNPANVTLWLITATGLLWFGGAFKKKHK